LPGLQRPALPPPRPGRARRALLLLLREEGPAGRRPGSQTAAWLALVPDQYLTLIAVVDDATKQVLYAALGDGGESTAAVMTALRAVLTTWGLPMALYTDRAHWAAHTPVAGGAADRTKLTQVGRALVHLGIEHILGYSPQARGRSERMNGTLQGRLVNELRVAGITTVAAANRYLREGFLPAF